MTYTDLIYTKQDGIATVTLNRPEALNSMSPNLRDEVIAVFEEMAQDPEVLVTILTGAGRGFCSGAFVKDPATHEVKDVGHTLMTTTWGWFPWDYPKPLIAAVNGVAYGSGFNIVLCADIIIASTEARFCFPMARLGIIPSWPGVQTLALYVGKAKAGEMALTARPIDGEDAYRWGLANKCVEPDQLMEEAMVYARRLAAVAPLSARLIKAELQDSYASHFDRKRNRLRVVAAQSTYDREEGHVAWREKREPKFIGR